MILTELRTEEIPEIYMRFARVVDDTHWRKRVAQLKSDIKGSRFLLDYIQHENSIAFQLERLRELNVKHGAIPSSEVNNHAIYPAVAFAAQALSIMETSPRRFRAQLKRRIHGAFKNPDDMRGLRLELSAATHFSRRGFNVTWPEMTSTGAFDLMVADLGPNGLEVECKSISADKGRKVHRREALDFYNLLWPHLEATSKGLSIGLSIVLTIPGRLPTNYRDRLELAKLVGKHAFRGQSAELPDGSSIRITEFDVGRFGNIPLTGTPQELRAVIDGVTETRNRESIIVGLRTGGVLALAVQSAEDDTLMKRIFDTLSDSAKRQLSGTHGGMFLVGLHGIDGEQLRSIAAQDKDPSQPPTALRVGVSKYLTTSGRDHVVGVGFLAESALSPERDGHVEAGGTAYYFPKRESPFWHDNFSGLFSWSDNL